MFIPETWNMPRLAILGFLILICSPLLAQQPYLRFDTLTVDEGLSQNGAQCIVQDQQGFIWLGTQDGLNRYDGHELVVYRQKIGREEGLPSSDIFSLAVTKDGTLWAGTSAGLAFYDRDADVFRRLVKGVPWQANSGEGIDILRPDDHGGLWIGTENYGLAHYDGKLMRSFSLPNLGQEDYTNDVSQMAVVEGGVVLLDWQRTLWFFDAGKRIFRKLDLPFTDGSPIRYQRNFLNSDGDGGFWAGYANDTWGLFHRNKHGRMRYYPVDPANPSTSSFEYAQSIVRTPSGEIWLASSRGLSLLNPETGHVYTYHPNTALGLTDTNIDVVFMDTSFVLWVGTDRGGVCRMPLLNQQFKHYLPMEGVPDSLVNKNVHQILETQDGSVYICTSGGLVHWDRQKGRFKQVEVSPKQRTELKDIRAVLKDRQSRLWIGVEEQGLYLWDESSGEFGVVDAVEGSIYGIIEDDDGIIWLASRSGLYIYDPVKDEASLHHCYPKANQRDNVLFVVYQDVDGQIWTGFRGGIFTFDRESGFQAQMTLEGHDSVALILDILDTGDGYIWVGTQRGLVRHHKQTNQTWIFTEADGLPNDTVYKIIPDAQGSFWLSTNQGLVYMDTKALTYENYTFEMGIQSNEFNFASGIKLSDGTLVFGGVNGITTFRPDDTVVFQGKPPLVNFTSFSIANQMLHPGDPAAQGLLEQAIWQTDQLELNHAHYLFEFEFVAPNSAYPGLVKYAYRMDGLNDAWVQTHAKRRHATFTRLPPKRYKLQVKGAGLSGGWGPVRSLDIIVHPPLWRTWQAYVLYITIGLGLIWGWVHIKQRALILETERMARFNTTLEREVANRTEELKQRNEELSERNREMETMDTIVRAVNREMDLKAVIYTIMREGNSLLPHFYAGAFCLVQRRDKAVLSSYTSGSPPEDWAAPTDATVLYKSIDNEMESVGDFLFLPKDHQGPASAVIRFAIDTHAEALILLWSNRPGRAISEHDRQILGRFREHLLTAVGKAKVLNDLARTQRELMEEAHLAGMAEIAANVLHHVGNTLNNVRTSSHLIAETLGKSKVPGILEKFSELATEHGDNLAQFLANDPKGNQLPKAFNLLHKKLEEERKLVVEETQRLEIRLALAMEALAEQQNHALVQAALLEPIDLNDLIDDALATKAHLIRQKQMTIVKKLGPIPLCPLDRQKMHRVLFYLLKNAWEAIEEEGVSSKSRIEIETRVEHGGQLFLCISDNGCGIEPALKDQIFVQGFSTKEGGKGFGLHYCANAVREMGGSLQLESDGLGKGCRVELVFNKG